MFMLHLLMCTDEVGTYVPFGLACANLFGMLGYGAGSIYSAYLLYETVVGVYEPAYIICDPFPLPFQHGRTEILKFYL